MYIHNEYSSVTCPVKKVKGFERINLNAGETKPVTFEITPQKLEFYNREMKRLSRYIDIMVGGNSKDLINQKLEVIK